MKNINEEMYEKNLPPYLEHDLIELKKAAKMKQRPLIYDCLLNELQGSVNSAYWDGVISEEQCDYFYRKYIEGSEYN